MCIGRKYNCVCLRYSSKQRSNTRTWSVDSAILHNHRTHWRTVTVFPKSHRKFLRTVFSNRKFLSVVLHSINDFPLLALLTMFKSSKTKKKWCRATKKGRSKSKWVLAQRRSSYKRECHKTDCKKIVLADKNTIDRKKDFLHGIKGDGGQ